MRRIVLTILVLFVCLSMSVSCTRKAEKKEKKKGAGVGEKAIIGPIEKAKGVQEKSKERADTMEKQADEVSGETKE
ncbi:MAG: hypothetical protein C4291_13655 [Candidatus Dadabacteria bacterium]|mgnify:CR=1 FL=1